MTQEDKDLRFKDLCARLPYAVKCHYDTVVESGTMVIQKSNCVDELRGIMPLHNGHIGFVVGGTDKIDALEGDIKPYLRQMSSMTKEEGVEYSNLLNYSFEKEAGEMLVSVPVDDVPEYIEWLLAHHFDVRDLIGRGLALEAPKDMYKTD